MSEQSLWTNYNRVMKVSKYSSMFYHDIWLLDQELLSIRKTKVVWDFIRHLAVNALSTIQSALREDAKKVFWSSKKIPKNMAKNVNSKGGVRLSVVTEQLKKEPITHYMRVA